jgi:hypothetical protein
MEAKRFGMQDIPIGKNEDWLNVERYAKALAKFILDCGTPMAIALQGEWGSGKTSLMNLTMGELENKVIPIWFNTWQFSQFDLSDALPVLMIEHFTTQISTNMEKSFVEQAKQVKDQFWRIGKKVGGIAVAASGRAMGLHIYSKDVQPLFEQGDPVTELNEAKQSLIKIVSKRREKDSKKLVIFIDDLDRLIPKKALELLEVIKLFLDIEGCVFVFACDYDIVKKGVEDKFGSTSRDVSGRSFFDKIFQLSFRMPVSRYTIDKYVEELLGRVHMEFEQNDLQKYVELLRYSVGFNPRNIKRLINTLLLLNTVVLEIDAQQHDTHRQKVLFAVVCLETAFPSLHDFLMSEIQNDDEWLSDLIEDKLQNPEEVRRILSVHQLAAAHEDADRMLNQIVEFMKVFENALHVDGDKTSSPENRDHLSSQELNHLRETVALTILTSTTGLQRDTGVYDTWKDEITKFCQQVYNLLKQEDIGDFRHSKKSGPERNSRIYVIWPDKTPWDQWCLSYVLQWFPAEKEFRVNLRGRWKYLKDNLDKSQEVLWDELNNLPSVKEGKAKLQRDKKGFSLEISLGNVEWTNESAKNIAETLRDLIQEGLGLFGQT